MPRPLIPNTSSIGIRNGWSVTRVGWGDVLVHRGNELPDTLHGFGVARECFESADPDNGGVVAREAVAVEQLADFHLDELEEFLVVRHIDLVQRDDDGRDIFLAGQEDVFAGLGHRPVGGGYHQNCPVHLGGAGDHVLDVVGVARAVDVGVVAVLGLVLDVGDGDAASHFLRALLLVFERVRPSGSSALTRDLPKTVATTSRADHGQLVESGFTRLTGRWGRGPLHWWH